MSYNQDLLREYQRRTKARDSIYDYLDYMRPCGLLDVKHEPAEHHKLIIDDVHQMIDGHCEKECFSFPPGAAKSTYLSVILPTFLWLIDPTWNILCISNSESLAEDFARRRRSIFRTDEWKLLADTSLEPDAQSLAAMKNRFGGTMYAVGAGSTITGLRADWIIMDDLVKGFEQANSISQLDKIWNWLLADARSRLKPGGRELLVATRWSALDPIGRVLELTEKGYEDWKYIRVPMEADSDDDPLGREMGEPLWKEWFTPKMLNDAKREPAIWNCLYQQNPMTGTGEWLPPEHVHYITQKPKIVKYYIGVDIALTISDKSDWTVFGVVGIDENKNLVIVDIYRVQDSVDNTSAQLVLWTQQYQPIGVFIDDDNASKVFAKLVWEQAKNMGVPVPLQFVPMKGRDKEVRASALRSYFLQDKVQILQAPWNMNLIDELSKFPAVSHDDQVDGLAVVASQVIKLSAPQAEVKAPNQPETMIGVQNGQLVLNESLDDLFNARESGGHRFTKLRL